MELKLGLLASHNGSNVKAILESIRTRTLDAIPMVVISNNPDARVLDVAESYGVPRYVINGKHHPHPSGSRSADEAIRKTLEGYDVTIVILAGYMKRVDDQTLAAYPNRILNIHPALLPKYGGKGMHGMQVHEAVIQSDDTMSGASVHIVTAEYDTGRIIGRHTVPRYPSDTAETLASRVLAAEHALYPQVLRDIKAGTIDLDAL